MQKTLYIIRGEHTDELLDDIAMKEASACYDLHLNIVGAIARKTGCSAYFSDGQKQEEAKLFNSLLNAAALSPSVAEELMSIMQNCAGEVKGSEDAVKDFQLFLQLRREGIPIKFMPTEGKIDHFEILKSATLEGKLPLRDYVSSRLLVNQGGDPDLLILSNKVGPFLNDYRDRCVFENVRDFAEQTNILFMGRDHALKDFADRPHPFAIHEMEIYYDSGVHIRGNVPSFCKPLLEASEGVEQRVAYF